jgi:hypothetical protein
LIGVVERTLGVATRPDLDPKEISNMPQEENYVSLWVGITDGISSLKEFVRNKYSEDGDLIPSPFAHDFNISRYDSDFVEIEYFDKPPSTIQDILSGFSYAEELIPKFAKLLKNTTIDSKTNAVILLYNFKYDNTAHCSASKTRVKFLGYIQLDGK